jgi:LysR family glycine cleavage system transcriptional activator
MRRQELPSLDLLLGFEAAARHLSFTKAAAELFLTQSAISRQVQALEDELGVPMFQRRHRALLLTDAGQLLYRSVTEVLAQLRDTTRLIHGVGASSLLNVTTTISFASLWLVGRLPHFRANYPGVDVRIYADNATRDLARDRIDVAIRHCIPSKAPDGAVLLFGEEVLPMCSPALMQDAKRPLRTVEDLRHHVLLHDDEAPLRWQWLDWGNWFRSQGLRQLQPAGELRFSHYDQMIQAAVEGQGVALGRLPLLSSALSAGRLVMPFENLKDKQPRPTSQQSFFIVATPQTKKRREVQEFIAWLLKEANPDGVAAA